MAIITKRSALVWGADTFFIIENIKIKNVVWCNGSMIAMSIGYVQIVSHEHLF